MPKAALGLMHPFPIQHILHLDIVPVTDEIHPFLFFVCPQTIKKSHKGSSRIIPVAS